MTLFLEFCLIVLVLFVGIGVGTIFNIPFWFALLDEDEDN